MTELLEHFSGETEYISSISKRVIESAITICKLIAAKAEKAGSTVFGKIYEDLSASLRLVGKLAVVCKQIANFVIPFHY